MCKGSAFHSIVQIGAFESKEMPRSSFFTNCSTQKCIFSRRNLLANVMIDACIITLHGE